MNSENRYSISESRLNRREKFICYLQKFGLSDFLTPTDTSARIWSFSVFTITDIHSFYIFKAMFQQIRQISDEKIILFTTFILKMRALTFLSLEIQDTDHFILFALFKDNYVEDVTVKEDANRKQSHHKERCPGKHNVILAFARENLLKRNALICFSIKTARYLLFRHLRQLQNSKTYCPKEGLWLWSQQHLDMPVASPKWPLPIERGETRIEKTCENWKGNLRVKFLVSNLCFLCCLSERIKLCFEGAATEAV